MKKITLGVSGMSCSACSNGLEKHLNKQEGIISASVNLVMANTTIEYDESVLDIKKLEGFIKQAGFKSTGVFDLKAEEKRKSVADLIIFGVLAVLTMYVSMGHMIHLPIFSFCDMHKNPVGYAITQFCLVVPFLIYGGDILINGVKSLIHLSPNMDTLVMLGVISSLGYSVFSSVMIILGDHGYASSLYFEACASVIFFIKLGRRIDKSSKEKTKQAIKSLVTITPENATVKINDELKVVTIDEVNIGDTVVSKAGEKFAVDGVITSGSAHVDESFITGESKPVLKTVGDTVIAGSINFDGYIEYSAEKIGKNSTVSEIVHMVVEASNTKLPIAQTADKVCGIFVPSVMAIALVSFLAYLIAGAGIEVALTTFVTVLVVACPCALGLATPLAVIVGEGLCASRGILVKNGKSLEVADGITTVVFDKTGTLTHGNLKIATVKNYSEFSETELLRLSASLEVLSTHPIGRAFKNFLEKNNLSPLNVQNFKNVTGKGIYGEVDGKKVLCGNAKLLAEYGVENSKTADEVEIASSGCSIVYVSVDGELKGIIGVNDVIKDDAREVISLLNAKGIKTVMLTGDNKAVADRIASSLNITEVIAEVLPKDKADYVNELKSCGERVLMCGDGINDSPALTTADIGVAVKNGTDIAMDSADVVLMTDDLFKITDFLAVSKRTLKCIRQNLFWAFFYNALMIPIAVGALKFINVTINPMLAGIAMVLSSLTVIFNTLRMKTVKLHENKNNEIKE